MTMMDNLEDNGEDSTSEAVNEDGDEDDVEENRTEEEVGHDDDDEDVDDNGDGQLVGDGTAMTSAMNKTVMGLVAANNGISTKAVIRAVVEKHNLRHSGDGLHHVFYNIIKDRVRYLKKVSGPPRLVSLQDVLNFLIPQSLDLLLAQLPAYNPRSDYKNLDELCDFLGCDQPSRLILLRVKESDIVDVEQTTRKSVKDDDKQKILGSIIATCPGHLWTMCQLMGPKMDSLRCLHADESVKFTKHIAEQMLSIGPCSIDTHGQNFDGITKLFRPAAHCLTACRSFGISFVLYRVLSRAVYSIFGKPLRADAFVTDYSGALRMGLGMASSPTTPLLICFPHMFGCVDGRWRGRFKLTKAQVKLIRRHMSMLYACRSWRAFTCLYGLATGNWREVGLTAFAKFFDTYYGPSSTCKGQWYVYATDTVFLYPNNNPIEGYWKDAKGSTAHGIPAAVDVNMSPGKFMMSEFGKLLEHDCTHHCGASIGTALESIVPWVPLDFKILGVCAMVKSTTDVNWIGERRGEAFISAPACLGHFPGVDRINDYNRTYNGTGQYASPDDFAKKHLSMCHVFACSPTH
jgi:hypothetical protein